MMSKAGQDLARYFPEVAAAAKLLPEKTFSLDGELVVQTDSHFSFDDLLQRIHPAASRIQRLSQTKPALYIAFDLLRRGKKDFATSHLTTRRLQLEKLAHDCFTGTLFKLSPASRKVDDAKRWLSNSGSGSDGVIAKRLDLPYQAGNRDGMQKIKKYRTADCVIGGYRYGKQLQRGKKVVASVLLGLYDNAGRLNHVGFTSSLSAAEKLALTSKLERIQTDVSFTGDTPGGASRWSTARSSDWHPVKPSLVVEVSYDHFTGGRFRHGTTITRWRPDKRAAQCTLDQLKQQTYGLMSELS